MACVNSLFSKETILYGAVVSEGLPIVCFASTAYVQCLAM